MAANRRFDLILFDLDGTLFDTKQTILNAVCGYVKKAGLRPLTTEEVESFFGPPAIQSFKKYYPQMNDDEISNTLAGYRKYYIENELLKAKMYDGTIDVLKKLKEEGYKIALATYKLMTCVTPLLAHYDLAKYFDAIKGSVAEIGGTKTDIMREAIEACKVTDSDRICMIGDTDHDFGGAVNLNVSFIAVNYSHTFDNLSIDHRNYKKFIGICDKAREILDVIEQGVENEI